MSCTPLRLTLRRNGSTNPGIKIKLSAAPPQEQHAQLVDRAREEFTLPAGDVTFVDEDGVRVKVQDAESGDMLFVLVGDEQFTNQSAKHTRVSPQDEGTTITWDRWKPTFYFVPREVILQCSITTLPRMQELRPQLVQLQVDLGAAVRGMGCGDKLFISHRWTTPEAPDPDGAQLREIQSYLRTNPGAEYVWYDFWCMPQRERTTADQEKFDRMLVAIADLYLTTPVLILLSTDYMGRFWCTLEAWCAMQTATPDGLRPATRGKERYEIRCFLSAPPVMAHSLIDQVSRLSANDMHTMLANPDILLTNAKDKQTMLPKVFETDAHIKEIFTATEGSHPPTPPPPPPTAAEHLLTVATKDYRQRSDVTKLSLMRKEINDELAVGLANALPAFCGASLKNLELSHNRIGNPGVVALVDVLRTATPQLRWLWLDYNAIGEAGAAALRDWLTSESDAPASLVTLGLGGNLLGDAGARVMSELIERNGMLTELRLKGNAIGDAVAEALAAALKTNSSLTKLFLDGNQFSETAQSTLRAAAPAHLIRKLELKDQVQRLTAVIESATEGAVPPIDEWMRSGLAQVGVALPAGSCWWVKDKHGQQTYDKHKNPLKSNAADDNIWTSVSTPAGEMRVKGVGSGFVIDPRGFVFTCEHVRSACQEMIQGAADNGFTGGAILVAPYLGRDHGGETNWTLSWVADVLAYTSDWNPVNAARPPDPDIARMAAAPGLSVSEWKADAAVLRPIRCLADGHDVRGQNPLKLLVPDAPPVLIMTLMAEGAEKPSTGVRLWSFGFPPLGGKSPTHVELVMQSNSEDDADGEWLKFVGGIMPGHSGGPVVDRQGRVVAWNVRDKTSGPDKVCHLRFIRAGRACIREGLARATALADCASACGE